MLNSKHRAEIEKSVPPTDLGRRIVDLNFRSIDNHEVPRILNRAGSSKWKQVDYGPGWAVSGVDPKSGEPSLLGVQVKLDNAQMSADGRALKYLSASGYESQPLFLDTGSADYWSQATADLTRWHWITEGAKKAACLLALGEAAISLPGVENWQAKQITKPAVKKFVAGAYVALAFDMDWLKGKDGKPNVGVLRALDKLGREIVRLGGIPLIVSWDSGKGKGIDDYLVAVPEGGRLAALEDLKSRALTFAQWKDEVKSLDHAKDDDSKIKWTPGLYLINNLTDILHSEQEDFISVLGTLHRWTGTHYEPLADDIVLGTIQAELSKYSFESKGQTQFPFAKTAEAKEALAYLKQSCAVSIKDLPRSGVPLANGVLEVNFDSGEPEFNLVPHDKSQYYLHCSDVEFNPDAPQDDCDRLLSAIMPEQVQTWLEHQSMRFDFAASAQKFGRPRAAFHEGTGSNGKDACRTAVRDLFPEMASFTLNDFQQYEEGRKFGLATLPKYALSWSSENSHKVKLENLKCLMNAISGNGSLVSEFKNRDPIDYDPACIFHFNVNRAPITDGMAEYLTSRFAIYSYPFTFSSSGEDGKLKADSRFAYDADWRKKNVSSALLNRLISAFKAAWNRGRVDWSSSTERLRQWAQDRNHFLQFCDDFGLVAGSATDSIEIAEIWDGLTDWYCDNEYLKILPNAERDWASDPSTFDPLVKKSQDIFARLQNLFPHIKRSRSSDKNRRAVVCGLWRMNPDSGGQLEDEFNHPPAQSNPNTAPLSIQPLEDAEDNSLLKQSESINNVCTHNAHIRAYEKGDQHSSSASSNGEVKPRQDAGLDVGGEGKIILQSSSGNPDPSSGDPILELPLGTRVRFPWPDTPNGVEGVIDNFRPNPFYPSEVMYHVQNGTKDDWFAAKWLQVIDS